MAGEVREPEVTHVTIVGRITPLNSENYLKLCYLAYKFRRNLAKAVKMYARGVDRLVIVKEITRELNLGYADTIYKMGFSSDVGLCKLMSLPHLCSPAFRSGFHRA